LEALYRKVKLARDHLKVGLVVAFIVLGAGCQAYIDGQSRTVGEFTDDARIQAAVKTALVSDEAIKGWPMNVEVNRGVVGLYGRVASEALREKAIRLVREVRGVVEVQDKLRVEPEA